MMVVVAVIGRFFVFVAAILVKHHLRRLWLGAATRAVRSGDRRGTVAVSGTVPSKGLPGHGTQIENRGLAPPRRSSERFYS
jgi:hypothetical protein